MTVMIYGNGEGTHRCDARCHDASEYTKCTCICGGRNHGKGRAFAQRTAERIGERLLQEYARKERERLEQQERTAGQIFLFGGENAREGAASSAHHRAAEA